MKSLFINTSTKQTIVAIIIDKEIKYLYKQKEISDLSSLLMPTIDEAFKKTNLTPNDIDTIFVTNGPGSFTGIRIGLTVAKVMAWGLKIKVVPISSLEAMAATKTDKEYVVPLIDARRECVYAGVYDNKLNTVINDEYIALQDLNKKIANMDVLYVTDDEFSFAVNEPDYDILRIIEKHENDAGINPHELNPNYLKKTEAEEKLLKERG